MQLDPASAPSVPDDPATVSPVAVPVVSVGQLLTEARVHERSRTQYANQKTGKTHTPDYTKATEQARLALAKRLQAHELDPRHTDPAWALDKVPHARIVDFLQTYVDTP